MHQPSSFTASDRRVRAASAPAPAFAQGTKPAPKTAKPPAKSAPAPKKPPAACGCRAPAPPPPAPPSDVRFKTTYTNGDQITESTSFIRDNRERYELGDTILLKQHDQKRIVQISRRVEYLPGDVPKARRARRGAGAAPRAARRRDGHHVDRRHRRTQGRVRPDGAPRADRDRSAAAARRLRSVEDAHRDRRVVHRSAEGRWPRRHAAMRRGRLRLQGRDQDHRDRRSEAAWLPDQLSHHVHRAWTTRMPSRRSSRWTSPSSKC